MQAAQEWDGTHATLERQLDGARLRRVVRQRPVRPRLVVMGPTLARFGSVRRRVFV